MKRILIISVATIMGATILDAAMTCIKCQRVPTCIFNGQPAGDWTFCGSYDMDNPQQCRRTTKRLYNCLEGGQSYDYADQYMLGYVCIAGSDCY